MYSCPTEGLIRNINPVSSGRRFRRLRSYRLCLQDVPGVLGSMTELAASNTGRETKVADGNLLVDIRVSKVVGTLGHSTNEDANAFIVIELVDVAPDLHDGSVETEGDFAALWGQVVGDGVLNDTEQFFLRIGGFYGETVEQLDHEAGKTLEGTRDSHRRRHLYQDTLGGGDVDL